MSPQEMPPQVMPPQEMPPQVMVSLSPEARQRETLGPVIALLERFLPV
jgi:hypothetical protein